MTKHLTSVFDQNKILENICFVLRLIVKPEHKPVNFVSAIQILVLASTMKKRYKETLKSGSDDRP